jgi:Acyl transferase domain/Polyketide synthase dehydratase
MSVHDFGEARVVWCAGASTDEVLAQLDHVDTAGTNGHSDSGPVRLGIVDPTDRKLRLARRLVAKGEPWRGRSDIWFTPEGFAHRDGKIAFLFPGVEPTFEVETVDLPALGARFGIDVPVMERDTVPHQSRSIFRLGLFLDAVLRQVGIRPDLVAGHSIGEWAGTVCSGMVPPAHADELVAFIDLDAVELPDVDFAALSAGADTAAAVVADIDGVVLSHDNCPIQSVVCGPPAAVDQALAELRRRNVLGYKLDFQSGFHTPAIAPMIEGIRALAQALPFGPGHTPMWSSTITAPYPPTHDAIVALHLRHLVEPVRFRSLVERLHHDAGARIFLQIGLGSLPGFINDTLRDDDHLSISLLSPKRTALAQLHRVVTALWVEGLALEDSVKIAAAAPAALSQTVPAAPSPADEPALSAFPSAAAAPFVDDPLLAAADMLQQAAHAGRDVVEALSARLGLQPAARAAAPGAAPQVVTARAPAPVTTSAPATVPTSVPAGPAASAPPMAPAPTAPVPPAPSAPGGGVPASGNGTGDQDRWPPPPVEMIRHFSLETMPETIDHTLYHQPEGWPDVSDRFPIVAMTSQLAILRDIAAEAAGGRDVVELNARMTRWWDLSQDNDVKIAMAAEDDEWLGVLLGETCRARIKVGTFPPAPRYEPTPLVNERPTTHTAQDLWDLRLMFHGPRFQGITSLGPIGDDGVKATFEKLDTPGVTLDNLGKVIAYIPIDRNGAGEGALPLGVDRIEIFTPTPPVGTEILCDVRLLELQDDLVKANGVLVLPDGRIWCRVTGWHSIVFHLDELMEPLYHATTRNFVTEPQAGGWNVVMERWPMGAARELTSRRYCTRAERDHFQSLNLLQQRHRLLETVAVKDSVRRWLWENHGAEVYPVEVTYEADGDDRHFRVVCPHIPEGHDIRVTASVLERSAVAIVGDGVYHDIESLAIGDGEDPDEVAARAAKVVVDRNPGADVHQAIPPFDVTPSRLKAAPPPSFAVAWARRDG